MKDNEVKEKLESLGPLAGGVVFGKEEAWDKLQARLEKKPARKIPLLRLSAAAILLVGASIGTYRFLEKPEAEHTVALPNTLLPLQQAIQQPSVTAPEPQVPLNVTPETVRIVNTIKLAKKEDLPPVTEKNEVEPGPATVAITTPAPLPIVANEPLKQNVPINKMRVVHINDVGKTEEETAATYVYNGPALDIAKMKVVSLNDVQREESLRKQEEEVITMIRTNRPHGAFLGFANTVSWNGTSQRAYAQNPLSIRLNRNN